MAGIATILLVLSIEAPGFAWLPCSCVVSNFLYTLCLRLNVVLLLGVVALVLGLHTVEILVEGTLLVLQRLKVNCVGNKSNFTEEYGCGGAHNLGKKYSSLGR